MRMRQQVNHAASLAVKEEETEGQVRALVQVPPNRVAPARLRAGLQCVVLVVVSHTRLIP
jgi:hypothetical protein